MIDAWRAVFQFFWYTLSSVWGLIISTFLIFQVVLWLIGLGIKIIKKVLL